MRKIEAAKKAGVPFSITSETLFSRVNDLVGIRVLHLHTSQFGGINEALRDVLEKSQLPIIEGPIARVWDYEYNEYGTEQDLGGRCQVRTVGDLP